MRGGKLERAGLKDCGGEGSGFESQVNRFFASFCNVFVVIFLRFMVRGAVDLLPNN